MEKPIAQIKVIFEWIYYPHSLVPVRQPILRRLRTVQALLALVRIPQLAVLILLLQRLPAV